MTSTMYEADTVEKLLAVLGSTSTMPLWTQMTKLNPPAPKPRATPHLWRYDLLRPLLVRAGELVTEKQAERRVLLLVNPSMEAPYTTDTINSGLQLVMPNETAPAHRHTAYAMRFIIEGQGGFTAIHGERITMQRGDLILTPSWKYHDHGKDGSGPMIWLDQLNLPSFRHFPVHFVEHYNEPRYPAIDVDSTTSDLVFPWVKMQKTLDAERGSWTRQRYLTKSGKEVSKSLGASAERIQKGGSSSAIRDTLSAVYHVVSGKGYTMINDTKYDWEQGDTFCIPSWHKYQHFADTENTVYLYRCDDLPMIKALGFYRVEGKDFEEE